MSHSCVSSLGAKAYMVTLVLTSIAGKYEMLPLTYDEDFRSHTTKYTNFTLRIEVSGVRSDLIGRKVNHRDKGTYKSKYE